MRRSGAPLRRTRLRRVNLDRARTNREYAALEEAYLREHPFCMIWIAEHGLRETDVIASDGWATIEIAGRRVRRRCPAATEVHHRNKARGVRKNDQRWWMAASRPRHDYVEACKTWARAEGYLLPFEADPEGRLPDGSVGLTTPDLMAKKVLPNASE